MRVVLFVSCLSVLYASAQDTTALPETTEAVETTVATCVDDPNANCDKMKAYCDNPAYHDLLGKECPGTCPNLCNPAGDCVDIGKNCEAWKANGFCTNPFYTNDKDKFCKKTCGDC